MTLKAVSKPDNRRKDMYTADATEEALEIRTELRLLSIKVTEAFLSAGDLLLQCQRKNYVKMLGYENVDDLIERELRCSPRTGRYWMRIFEVFIEQHEVSFDILTEIGWKKLSQITEVVALNPKTKEWWLAYAKSHSVREVDQQVANQTEGQEHTFTSLSVAVTPSQKKVINQALEEAKKLAGTEHAGVALEYLAAESLASRPAGGGAIIRTFYFSPEENNVVQAGIDLWKNRCGGMPQQFLVALVQEWLDVQNKE